MEVGLGIGCDGGREIGGARGDVLAGFVALVETL